VGRGGQIATVVAIFVATVGVLWFLWRIIPRLPKGGVKAPGSITTTAEYRSVASHTVAADRRFQLSKVAISAEKGSWVRFRWNGEPISSERFLDDRSTLVEHFPWDYHEMVGPGTFEVQAKYHVESGVLTAEIVGEEV